MEFFKKAGLMGIFIFLFVCSAFAQEVKVGELLIINPTIRATPPNAPVSGGYLTIKNTGDSTERLVGASVAFAGKTELHEMIMQDDIMKMREISNGIEIPAGGEIVLKPGGNHVMFMKIDQQMKAGNHYSVMLKFENAGNFEVEFHVKDIAGMNKMMHNHNTKMKHDDNLDGATTN